MNNKTLTAICSVLILSIVVVGMRLFIFKESEHQSQFLAETTLNESIKSSDTIDSTGESVTSTLNNDNTNTKVSNNTFSNSTSSNRKENSTLESTKVQNKTTKTKTTTTQNKSSKTTKKTTVTTTAYTGVVTGFEKSMLSRVNEIRAEYGASKLILNNNLNKLAKIRAKEISESYRSNHARPNGSDWSTVLSKLKGTSIENWTSAGENIAYGQIDSEEAVEAFEASTSHLNNMVTSYYTHAGFGCYSKEGVLYWVQIFVGV